MALRERNPNAFGLLSTTGYKGSKTSSSAVIKTAGRSVPAFSKENAAKLHHEPLFQNRNGDEMAKRTGISGQEKEKENDSAGGFTIFDSSCQDQQKAKNRSDQGDKGEISNKSGKSYVSGRLVSLRHAIPPASSFGLWNSPMKSAGSKSKYEPVRFEFSFDEGNVL
jgi:hypothetical protein